MNDSSIAADLRDAAMREHRSGFRTYLRGLADAIVDAADDAAMNLGDEHLKLLNGLWAAGRRALKHVQVAPEPEPPQQIAIREEAA